MTRRVVNTALGIDYFRAIQGAVGRTTAKDVKVYEVRRRFENDFDSSIGVVYDATRNDLQQDFIITPTKEKNKCNVYTRPGEELNIGDIIFWNQLHWLVIDKDFQNDIYNVGTIVRCNRIIRWQNPATREIIERWCFCSKPYTSNVEKGSVITTLKGKYDIQLPYDEETIQVGVDKRLMLDIVGGEPMVYKLIFPDTNTNKYQDIEGGFIEWTVESDAYVPDNDNVDLMICDYISPGAPIDPPVVGALSCKIDGRTELRCGGSPRTWKPVFYQSDGVTPDETVIPKWSIIILPEHEQYYNILQNGNFISISVADNEAVIGSIFKITLLDEAGLYQSCELTVEVVSAIG